MHSSLSKFVGAAALLACSIALTGCISHHHTTVYEEDDPVIIKSKSNTKVVKVTKPRQFYYYASCQVYRDCESNRWFWREGNVWKVATAPPRTVIIEREVPYVVMIEAEEPKDHHEVIVKTYPNKRMDVRVEEANAPRKTLPPQAQGVARGHDKQNALVETVQVVERPTEVKVVEVVAPAPSQTVAVVEPSKSEGQGTGQGNSKADEKSQGKAKGKDKDDDKSDKKDKKEDNDKGKGKGKKD